MTLTKYKLTKKKIEKIYSRIQMRVFEKVDRFTFHRSSIGVSLAERKLIVIQLLPFRFSQIFLFLFSSFRSLS